jgi:hypothetical protein
MHGSLRYELALRRLVVEPENRAALRRLLDGAMPGGAAQRMSDAAVVREVERLLASGRLVLREEARIPNEGGFVPLREPEAPPAPEPERKKPAQLTWIEIVLVGEDDKPIPGERYRIELPDGSTREGRLDGRGLARVDGVDPGTCEVTFPGLDQDAWVKA